MKYCKKHTNDLYIKGNKTLKIYANKKKSLSWIRKKNDCFYDNSL